MILCILGCSYYLPCTHWSVPMTSYDWSLPSLLLVLRTGLSSTIYAPLDVVVPGKTEKMMKELGMKEVQWAR